MFYAWINNLADQPINRYNKQTYKIVFVLNQYKSTVKIMTYEEYTEWY